MVFALWTHATRSGDCDAPAENAPDHHDLGRVHRRRAADCHLPTRINELLVSTYSVEKPLCVLMMRMIK
jgi:hypothetical protein